MGTGAAVIGAARGDHVCWAYDDLAALRPRAGAFLAEGFAAGQRLAYLGVGSLDALAAGLAQDERAEALLERGAVTVHSLDDFYDVTQPVDPVDPVRAYAAATEDALAAGYTGLRVVAEATKLVRTPAQREAFTRYEHLIDRYMVDNPFAALCAYDRAELGLEAVAELACLHPEASDGATPFRWSAAARADVDLRGEVDSAGGALFDRCLERTVPLLGSPRVVVDARGLDFIDHRGLLALERHACSAGTEIVLETSVRIVQRLAALLGLRAVRVGWSA